MPFKRHVKLELWLLVISLLVVSRLTTAQSCLPEGITFASQAHIDSFKINYPGCVEIIGNVKISGQSIINLEGLDDLVSIGEALIIEFNDSLTTLNGLQALINVDSNLQINNNNGLINLNGLDAITTVGNDLAIYRNPVLKGLDALGNLNTIGQDIAINYCDALNDLSGLDSITRIERDIWIMYNPSLINLNGLGEIALVQGNINIWFNDLLATLTTFNHLSSIEGDFRVVFNSSLVNLGDLSSLHKVGGFFDIGSDKIASLNGLEALDSVGSLSISSDELSSLQPLSNLTTIRSGLAILNCDDLYSMSGLESLRSFGGALTIRENRVLRDLIPLENVDLSSISSLRLIDNPMLSGCSVASVCGYLDTTQATVIIEGNAVGCMDRPEVEENCPTVSIAHPDIRETVTVYPNPVSSILYISSLPSKINNAAIIYDLTGQVFLREQNIENALDVSSLSNGAYVLVVVSGQHRASVRFVVQKVY
jgi:Secretion system C-terminal sorting domain